MLEEDPGGFEMSHRYQKVISDGVLVSLTRFKVSLEGFTGHMEGFQGFQRGLKVSRSRF